MLPGGTAAQLRLKIEQRAAGAEDQQEKHAHAERTHGIHLLVAAELASGPAQGKLGIEGEQDLIRVVARRGEAGFEPGAVFGGRVGGRH